MPRWDDRLPVGYVVSTWPRLSQSFVLTEILALERLGLPLRIFSTKDPGGEPISADAARVRAGVTYLSLRRHGKEALRANLRLLHNRPGRYFRTLQWAVARRRWGVVRRFFQAAYLADLLQREPVAHLHAHFATAPALVSMFVHELIGVPYTFTAHARDIYVDTQPTVLRAEMEQAETVVTISEYNRNYLSSLLGSATVGKVCCLYNGLDLRQYPVCPTTSSEHRPPTILAVGRLIEKKGLETLIEAAGVLSGRGRDIRVEIVGAGPLRGPLETAAQRLGSENRVTFRGAQPQEVIRQLYREAAVFALPCVVAADGDRDGIPTVLLEAMASGVPVVSTSVSGIPELIDHQRNGLLVAPGDASMLADALDRLLTDGELRCRLARAARETIESRFAIDRNVAELAEIFSKGVRR